MSKFFLNNQALNTSNFDIFKVGVKELMKIEKKQNHIFYRNDSCFFISFFLTEIFPKMESDRELYLLFDFFYKLSPCEVEIQDEVSANRFCNSEQNGFLGINFENISFPEHKKICNTAKYINWIGYYQSKFEVLESRLVKIKYTTRFKKSFDELEETVQYSIISRFDAAINHNCISFPDGNIVKNVSLSGNARVLELRVFSPVALRVYFYFSDGIYFLASLELKSNPDQNQDIRNAEKLLIYLSSN